MFSALLHIWTQNLRSFLEKEGDVMLMELPSVTPPGWRLQQRQREILKDRKVTSSVTAVLFLLSTLPKLIHNRPFNHASSEIGSWERCFFDYAACYLSCNNWRNDTTRGKSPELHFHVQIKFSSYIILHDWLYNLNMVFNECRTVYSFVGDFGQLFSELMQPWFVWEQ